MKLCLVTRQRFEQLTKELCVNMSGNRMCKSDLGTLNNQWRTSIIDIACLFIVNLSDLANVYYCAVFVTKCIK
jgi:hypothetical protein